MAPIRQAHQLHRYWWQHIVLGFWRWDTDGRRQPNASQRRIFDVCALLTAREIRTAFIKHFTSIKAVYLLEACRCMHAARAAAKKTASSCGFMKSNPVGIDFLTK
jgi:hypothetical protein